VEANVKKTFLGGFSLHPAAAQTRRKCVKRVHRTKYELRKEEADDFLSGGVRVGGPISM